MDSHMYISGNIFGRGGGGVGERGPRGVPGGEDKEGGWNRTSSSTRLCDPKGRRNSLLFTIIHHTRIHHYSPIFAFIHHYSQLLTTIHHYSPLSLFPTIHHHSPKHGKLEKQLFRGLLHGVIDFSCETILQKCSVVDTVVPKQHGQNSSWCGVREYAVRW